MSIENLEVVARFLKDMGATGIVVVLFGWVAKRYLDKKLESEKSQNQRFVSHYIEVHKQKIRNSELFFKKQYDASQDLYELKVNMLPAYRHPDMDWQEALEEMAKNLGKTVGNLQNFLNKYFTVLRPDIVEKLESAIVMAQDGQFGCNEEGLQSADFVYKYVKECSSLLKAEVDGQRLVELKEFIQNKT